jgi:hypothetical protein
MPKRARETDERNGFVVNKSDTAIVVSESGRGAWPCPQNLMDHFRDTRERSVN